MAFERKLDTLYGPWGLTPGEVRMLDALCVYRDSSEIARRLGIAKRTVEVMTGRAYKRLGIAECAKKTVAIAIWLEYHGVISLEGLKDEGVKEMARKSHMPSIQEALEVAPAGLTQIELQRITGASAETVHKFIHLLHDEGKVHIAAWKTDTAGKLCGGVYQARYKLGPGEDMPKPPPLTPARVHKRTVARAKAAGEMKELRARWAETEKRRYWRNKQVKPDALTAAFFGLGAPS